MTARSLRQLVSALLTILALAAPNLGSALPTQQIENPWLNDLDAARREAAASERFLLVDLYAEWCSWCKVLDRKVFSKYGFLSWAEERFVLLRVDIEDEGVGASIAERFAVMSLPMTLVVSPDMVRVGQVGGYLPIDPFKVALESELAAWDAFQQRYLAEAASEDPTVLRQLADDLHRRRDGARAAPLYEQVASGEVDDTLSLRFLQADSYRLAGMPEKARVALEEANQARDGASVPPALDEAIGILSFRIASDLGDCPAAQAALDNLLESHPRSPFAATARTSLEKLESTASCT